MLAQTPIPASAQETEEPAGNEPTPTEATGQPSDSPAFATNKLAEIDLTINEAIARAKLPGGVLWLERQGQAYVKSYGHRALEPDEELMTEDTIFDVASLTKVVATTPAIMLLVERGVLNLDDKVSQWIPDFQGEGTQDITVRHLLTHTSGLRPGLSGSADWSGYYTGIELACQEQARTPPGAVFRYSDINFILLGEVVRRASGERLADFTKEQIFEPLGMTDTGFMPSRLKWVRTAPTERYPGGVLRGIVHDPTARRMGGVAGHAGLFSTASDLARFARMMLQQGQLEGTRIFKAETVRLMTSVQSAPGVKARRGLGWDIDSPYAGPRGDLFPIGSYGHTGWTGTSMWLDPFSQTFVIFLSNRNHPTEQGSVVALRKSLGTLAAEAVQDFDFSNVPGALPDLIATTQQPNEEAGPGRMIPIQSVPVIPPVRNGIDVLVARNYAPLKNLRIGLITNHTGTDAQRRRTIDLLYQAAGVHLMVLFSPEHGLKGQLDSQVADGRDEATGLPVFSLYGESRAPSKAQLQDLDALVFDIQDIGARFYTYVSTMGLAMEAAANAGLKFFVLDRVNPINGVTVEGPIHQGASEFVAFHSLPVRHGMTVGEIAKMLKAEREWDLDLTVIPLDGWARAYWYDQTGLPWTNPSPNMRNLKQAILYPGIGLLETVVSVGRGTDTPFEVVGAPYINDLQLAADLNAANIPGVRFVPIRFTPTTSLFKNQECGGVYIFLENRNQCPVVEVGLTIAKTLARRYPGNFALEVFNRLLQDQGTINAIASQANMETIQEQWYDASLEFLNRRSKYLIYR